MTYSDLVLLNNKNMSLRPLAILDDRLFNVHPIYCRIDWDNRYHLVDEIVTLIIMHKCYLTNIGLLRDIKGSFNIGSYIRNMSTDIELVVEDRMSGLTFWQSVDFSMFAPLHISVHSVSEYHPSGAYGTEAYLKAISYMNDSNKVYLLLPDSASVHSFNRRSSIQHRIKLACMNSNNIFCLFEYVSYESIFIDFAAKTDWFSYHNKSVFEDSNYVRLLTAISEHLNYFRTHSLTRAAIFTLIDALDLYNCKSMESLCTDLLNIIASNVSFRPAKRKLGNCWKLPCSSCKNQSLATNCPVRSVANTMTDKFNYVFRHAYVLSLLEAYLC